MIAETPALLAEARRNLPDLEAMAKAPAGREGVRDVLAKRFVLFPPPERGADEWAAWWSDYYDALEGIPLGSLEAAMGAWVKRPDAQFMPKPGELLTMARTVPCRSIQAFTRAQAAVRRADVAARPPANPAHVMAPPEMKRVHTPSTPEDRERVKRWAAEYRAQVQARPKSTIPLGPPCHGPTDETGLTPAMREHLARREA